MIAVPPTGRRTFSLDWNQALSTPPLCGATLESVTWELPTGYTLIESPIVGNKVFPVVTTTGLILGATDTLVCIGTLSNGDILPAAVEATVKNLATKISREECPV